MGANLFFSDLRSILSRHSDLYIANSTVYSKLATALLQLENNPQWRFAPFYCLPKVHKRLQPPYAGRPIVSAPSTTTYHVSVYLHRLLLPLLRHIPSICFSSRELIRDLHTYTDTTARTLLTADVCSLYPSIPIDFGVAAVAAFLALDDTIPTQRQYLIVDLLRWVLTNNYCIFKGTVYLQLKGTAMGTPVAVSYANIVLYQIERPLLIGCPLYRRYIDDVFATFISTQLAWQYYRSFNEAVPGIQFDTPIIGPNGIFLDLSLTLSEGRITSTLYQKPANLYSYIPFPSDHNTKSFANFIREELKRYVLNCSNPVDYYRVAQLFEARLIRRGYPPMMIALARTGIPTRAALLLQLTLPSNSTRLRGGNPNPRPTVVLSLPRLSPAPRWGLLLRVPPTLTGFLSYRLAYQDRNILVGSRNAANIAHMIMSSLYPPPPPPH